MEASRAAIASGSLAALVAATRATWDR